MTTPTDQPDLPAAVLAEYDQRYAHTITRLRDAAATTVDAYGLTTDACVALTRDIVTSAGDPIDRMTVYGMATVIAQLLIDEIRNGSAPPTLRPMPTEDNR
jgi:hypothetical protein